MGEVMPILIAGFAVLAVLVAVIARTQFNRKAVVKPMDQEDLVERIKIRITGAKAKSLSAGLVSANDDAYERKCDTELEFYDDKGRLIRFEICQGEKPNKR